ncbi:MAG: 1-deoxy-D-xylulose-5-phosphate reductoisomerase [Gammaproteobacteria bacterium]|nr:1-deoxy-D-xylulose-5-phosphate reductoisomerase [Gammaproteobacteria bacterium]
MTVSVAILGSTGSIGASTLDVIARHPDKYRVSGLSANGNLAAMRKQCAAFNPELAVMADAAAARQLAGELPGAGLQTRVSGGPEGLSELAGGDADIVVCGIVGAAGLRSTLAAVRGGKKVLIANKEPLVMLGGLIMREARAHGATVIPLDSEHNAIFQCLPAGGYAAGTRPAGVARILLTGSGGPFRRLPPGDFCRVTPAQARAHPNWDMGPKVSVDSATMMNKGLELIEACVLFSVGVDDIEIVIHPQSVVHSMVEYVDGSILAQLGSPDMRVAIANALGWPQRIDSGARRLSLPECARLDFEAPDHRRFPCIGLARDAGRTGGTLPAVMNAANEVAVDAFLHHGLRFDRIAQVVEATMARAEAGPDCTLEGVLEADRQARRRCRELLPGVAAAAVAVGGACVVSEVGS